MEKTVRPSLAVNFLITVYVAVLGLVIWKLSVYTAIYTDPVYNSFLESGIIEKFNSLVFGDETVGPKQVYFFENIFSKLCSIWLLEYIAIGWLIWQHIELKSIKFVFAKKTLEIHTGVFSKNVDMVEYAKIRDVEMESNFILRIFGKGNLYIIAQDPSGDSWAKRGFSSSHYKKIQESVKFANSTTAQMAITIKLLVGISNFKELAAELKDVIVSIRPNVQQV